MDIVRRAALSALVFIVICISGLFVFWIGGGQPFTPAAGDCAAVVLLIGAACSLCTWGYNAPSGN